MSLRLGAVPTLPRWLGVAGLLPQAAMVATLVLGDETTRFTALAIAFAYAALILSFLGGMWWGIAATQAHDAPAWIWFASVAPSLFALGSALPWATGDPWPGPSLIALGLGLLGSAFVDRRMHRLGLTPRWWTDLRLPLSIGLGTLTLAAALM